MRLAEANLPPGFILPETSADNVGMDCGDHVEIDLAVSERGLLDCGVRVNACILARASAAWMVRCVARKSLEEVPRIVDGFLCEMEKPLMRRSDLAGPWQYTELLAGRGECVLCPWQTLREALRHWTVVPTNGASPASLLSCDACVVAKRVRWGTPRLRGLLQDRRGCGGGEAVSVLSQQAESAQGPGPRPGKLGHRIRTFLQALQHCQPEHFPDELMFLQRLGKLVLGESDEALMREYAPTADRRSVLQLRRFVLPGIVGYHCKRVGCAVSPDLAHMLSEMRIQARLQQDAVAELSELIHRECIAAVPVKGAFTRTLYPDPGMRDCNDMDYLVSDLANCMTMIAELLSLGYEYPAGDSPVFSLKIVRGHDGEETLTGHFHLRKYRGHRYAEVDINFPGLPLGLLDTTLFPHLGADGRLSFDEQFAVTLTHLFKHEIAYMKDINDAYLMLAQPDRLDPAATMPLLRLYSLTFAAKLTCAFLRKEFGLQGKGFGVAAQLARRTGSLERLLIAHVLRAGWPYKAAAHLLAQTTGIFLRRRRAGGWSRALGEVTQLLAREEDDRVQSEAIHDPSRVQASHLQQALGCAISARIFLLPLLTYRAAVHPRESQLTALGQLAWRSAPIDSSRCIIFHKDSLRIMHGPVGLFLITEDYWEEVSLGAVEDAAWQIASVLCGREGAIPVRPVIR